MLAFSPCDILNDSIPDYTSKKQITNEEQVFLDNIGELYNYAFKFFSINNQTEKGDLIHYQC